MEYDRQEPQLAMYRPNLEDLPPVPDLDGFVIRTFQEGDEAGWERIIAESFEWQVTAGEFDRVMRADPQFDPDRIFFADNGQHLVGTAAAWVIPECGENTGRIHMVAVKPDYRGQKIGTALSIAVLHRFRHEGHEDANLRTDDFRLPGVKLYLNLGFEPYLVHENQRGRWARVFENLGMPELKQSFAEILQGPIHDEI